jgi:hypothetical protein
MTSIRRKIGTIALAILIVGCVYLFVKEKKSTFNAQNALTFLYDGPIWHSPDLIKYFDGKSTGYVTLAFESSYRERNVDKQVVIYHITPKPAEEWQCHLCTRLIGGAIFIFSDNRWKIESVNRIIGWGGHPGGEKITLEKIGKDKYGLMLAESDAHQGYETEYHDLIIPIKGSLQVALEAGFYEKPGSGECGDDTPSQKMNMAFDSPQNAEYFDVLTEMQFNERENKGQPLEDTEKPCGKIIVHKDTARYRFRDGTYKIIAGTRPEK